MIGIPCFIIGAITFINGLLSMNIVTVIIVVCLLIIAEISLQISKERLNHE